MGGALSFASWSVQALAIAKERLDVLGRDLMQGPAELGNVIANTKAALMTGMGVGAFTYVVVLLLVGIGVEWLYWSYAYASLRAAQAVPATSPREALRPGLRRFFLRLGGLLLFALAAIGASAAFSWPRGVQELVIAATLFVVVLRFAWIVIALVLAPGQPRLRLVPDTSGRAGWLAAAAMAVVFLLALGRFAPELMERLAGAGRAAGALRFAAVTLACLLLLATAFAFFGRRSRAPRFPRSFVLALLVVATYATWLLSPMAGTIAAVVAAVIALQIGLRELVFFFWREKDGELQDRVVPNIVLSAARFLIVLAGLGICALVMEAPLASLAAAESPLARIALRLVGVATLALLTHVIWITLRTAIDQRLSRLPPPGTAHEPDESSRLLTLLPLLRVTAAVLLLVMLVLSSLWALGLEITPVLAGAGVVGLALGFGAQALVRDVIAGIFFLAEDAFRIGEYIEAGSNAKGTVERITLRTVALRHHNGPLHFVPYGALGTVRNTSRDWVVEKFNLPLPIDVDSEKIRKLIKKVGEEMAADPEIGRLIQETLKGKLYRVDPGVKIFRCKFRTAPGKQFDVRAQAYKRIEAALAKMGVGFADGNQTVLITHEPAPAAAA
ncbi:MAG: moderate conductance mechanosensitive channel [Betaproteobacteria bacterium]|jgi:small-conductance mechanosensitive channel|nr:moderate conductance mechanosensitive channel [Betaproteobacteria bacterium]